MSITRSLMNVILIALLSAGLTACGPGDVDISATEASIRLAALATLEAQQAATSQAQFLLTATEEQLAMQATIDAQSQQLTQAAVDLAATAQAAPATVTPPPTLEGVGGGTSANLMTAKIDLNCRSGPSGDYLIVEVIKEGETAAVNGRNVGNTWINVTTLNGQTCWVINGTETGLNGDSSLLAIVESPLAPTNTPKPTQPPGISVTDIVEFTCKDKTYLGIGITPTGGLTFESSLGSLTNPATRTGYGNETSNNGFYAARQCSNGSSTLSPGETRYLAFNIDGAPYGIDLRIRVQACTDNGLKGDCYQQIFNYHR